MNSRTPTASTPLLAGQLAPSHDEPSPPSPSSDTTTAIRDDESAHPSKRQLGFWDGVAMVLCTQIGSGIFISPSLVVLNSGSKPVALLTWIVAGLLTWACALCYVELGVSMPLNGGPQEYLAHIFNNLAAFLCSWGTIFALKPCTAALLAVFVEEYLCDAIGLEQPLPLWYRKGISMAALAVLTFINCAGNTQSRAVTRLLVATKILGVIFVLVLALTPLVFPKSSPPGSVDVATSSSLLFNTTNYPDAVLQALYAFSGWETLSFIGGELKNPERIITSVMNLSMFTVISLFALANVAYFSALSFDKITQAATIAITYAEHFMGRAGGIILATFICLSGFGSLNVKIYTASRVTQAAAERRHLPGILETVEKAKVNENLERLDDAVKQTPSFWDYLQRPTHYKDGTIPFSAIIFNTILAFVYVLLGNLSNLVIFTGIVEYSIVVLTICGLIALRLRPRSPDAGTPPYQAPWILILVALFAMLFILGASVVKHPLVGFGFIAFNVATAVIHRYFVRK